MKSVTEIENIVKKMSLAEKASLCSGKDFWRTQEIDRLGIPSVMMTDGPHGLRKQGERTDHLGLSASVPSTCFPSGAGLASSWDRDIITRIGKAIGEEAQAQEVGIVLGPAVNIKRDPLCGRNFEYFSEDPYLTGELAKEYIAAVQSQGVGTSIKHFAANNQETRRMTIDTLVSERTLREIYLPAFEIAVRESQPWTVMCAYNKLNGVYCSEHAELLTTILKEEWGHTGIVVTDWGACNDRVAGLKAGMELEMPGSYGFNDAEITAAVQRGDLDEHVLDAAVSRILRVLFLADELHKPDYAYSATQHHALAREIAGECMVLLKNDNEVLPIRSGKKIAVIGAFAKNPRYQGGGSSHINPYRLDSAFEEICKLRRGQDGGEVLFADGYEVSSETDGSAYLVEALDVASQADIVVIFAGLRDREESEGFDRTHINLSDDQNKLILKISELPAPVVVVLSNGSPIAMPWITQVSGVIEGYLGGEAGGGAIADILLGKVNPSGKLAETFPVRLEDTPAYLNFPGGIDSVAYDEGIFVGYRYYEAKRIEPLFPFGFGLSYTSFSYSDMQLSSTSVSDEETVTISALIENTGMLAGKEVVQLYVRDRESSVIRPLKELKGFMKVSLDPGENRRVEFVLDARSFAYWNTDRSKWVVESGEFEILIGASSTDIRLKADCEVFAAEVQDRKFTLNSRLAEFQTHPIGRQVMGALMQGSGENLMDDADNDSHGALMLQKMLKDAPFRTLVMFSMGKLSFKAAEGILAVMNGELPVSVLGDLLKPE